MTNNQDRNTRLKLRLLSAMTLVGASLGVGLVTVPASAADDTAGAADSSSPKLHATWVKGGVTQSDTKLETNQSKFKGESHQLKAEGNQIKLDSSQQKGTHYLNPQPLPPG